ncbi:FAD-dependent oxidoreductase [Acididesulfobacillus acetoxydans]|nr:FAD-dependent oxidoreductase [Acididesulfobacillus acetoxydans]
MAKRPESFWLISTPSTDYPSLDEDRKADVAVVGGGIAGITAAYLLVNEGLNVVVLDADRIVRGTTAHTTAKLTSQHGLIYAQIRNQMGEEKARQYAEANEEAIRFVTQLIEENKIECDFSRQAAYIYTLEETLIPKIEQEQEVAAALGIKAFYQTEIPLPLPVKAALRFDAQAQFHPRKYLLALAAIIREKGGFLFENSKVVDIQGDGPYTLLTVNQKKVTAPMVILATHYPCHNFPGLYFTRLYTERAYAVAAKIAVPFPGGMYINAEQPARSLRALPTADGERVLVVGEKHKTGHGQDLAEHYYNLMTFAQELFPVEEFSWRWSTQDVSTLDDVPYIGRMTAGHPDIYLATGFRKWGMTGGTVAGLLLRDLIVKGESPWEDVYRPPRFTAPAAMQFVAQNADVAFNLIAGKLLPGQGAIHLQPGEAVLANVDGEKTGVYIDAQRQVHAVDTTCTHLGCELRWNNAESSWDCPCHGSRFGLDGEVLEGPAMQALEKRDLVLPEQPGRSD